MTATFAKILTGALAVSAITFTTQAQTEAMRTEEISIKAPFSIPTIKVPVFPKKDFNIT